MLSSTRDSLDQAAVSSAVPKSPGIPVDFEVQQPKSRSAKKKKSQWWPEWWSNSS